MQLTLRRLACGSVFGLLTSGCATVAPNPPTLPFEVPATWTQPSDAKEPIPAGQFADADGVPDPGSSPPDHWWKSFADPGLTSLVEVVLQNNQSLRQMGAVVEIAGAQARITGSEKWPSLTASADAGRRRQVFVGLPIPGNEGGVLSSRSDSFSALLSVSWEADLWGRIRHREAAADNRAAAAGAEFDAASLSLVGQAAKAWFTVIEAAQQHELAQETLDSLTATRERVAQRYRGGVAPAVELRLARTNEARARALLARRQHQFENAVSILEVLTGLPQSPIIDRVRQEGSALVTVPPSLPPGLPAELLARRPDLRALEYHLVASGHDAASARRALYPRVSLTGSGGTSSNALDDLLDGDFSIWSLAGSLLQPLFQGGKLRAAEDLALAEQDRALAAYSHQLLVAFSEVETALASERLLAVEEQALAAAEVEAEAATTQAESRYLAGLGSYLAFLESQRQWFAVRGDRLAVQRARLTTRVDLHLALGGDVSVSADSTPHDLTSPPHSATRSTR